MVSRADILGRGWAFPFSFSARGGTRKQMSVTPAEQVEKVNMSIAVILGTKLGSRVIERDFGSDLRGLIFQNIEEATFARVRAAIVDALTRWEKRIELLEIQFDDSLRKDGILNVMIHYRIISSQVEGNYVHPFYILSEFRVQGEIVVGA